MPRKYTEEEAVALAISLGLTPTEPYVNSNTPWNGVCLAGHPTSPKLNNLTNGQRPCNVCAGVVRGEARRRIGQASVLTVDTDYDILGFEYRTTSDGTRLWVHWECPTGHQGMTQSNKWLAGRRCRVCSKSGYSPTKHGTLYLLARVKDGVEERQYGISNDLKRRMSEHKRHNWTLIDRQSHKDGGVIQRREDRIKRAMKLAGVYPFQYSGEKFTGFTEAWTERMLEPFDSLPELNAWAIATIASHKETDGKRE